MRIVILFVLLAFLFLGNVNKLRNATIFNVVWIAVILINWVCVPEIDNPSDLAFVSILLFVFLCNIGFFAASKVGIKRPNSIICEFTLNKRLFLVVNVIAIVIFFVEYTLPSIRITQQYGVFVTRQFAYNASDSYFGSTLKLFIAQQLIYALFFSSMLIGVTELFSSKKLRLWKCPTFLIGVGEMLLYSYTFKGRTPIFVVLFFVLASYLLYYKWNKHEILLRNNKSIKRKIRIMVIALLIAMVMLSISRFDGLSQIRKFFIIYFGSQATYLSKLIEKVDISFEVGKNVFSGLLDFIKMVLNRFIGTQLTLGSNEIGVYIDGPTTIGNGITMNAGCTAIFYFYYELGILGVIVYSFIFGFITSLIQTECRRRNNKIWNILYLSSLYMIFYTYSGWSLKYLYFWLTPMLVRLFFRRGDSIEQKI